MDRISGSTVSTDLFGTGKNGFKDGNKASGIIATIVSALFLNGLQEEALSIIEAANLTPNAADRSQILQALRAAGVFQTAAQFDNTTKAATTAFVQRALGNARGVTTITATSSLTAADVGKEVVLSGAGAITITLPLANSVAAGSVFFFRSNAANQALQRAGSDSITMNGSTNLTSVTFGSGDTLMLVSNGSNNWDSFGGSLQLGYSASFASITTNNGFKLPNGWIVQIGQTGTIPTGTVLDITLPTTFPTSGRVLFAFGVSGGVATSPLVGQFNSTSSIRVCNNGSPIAAFYLAIGN